MHRAIRAGSGELERLLPLTGGRRRGAVEGRASGGEPREVAHAGLPYFYPLLLVEDGRDSEGKQVNEHCGRG